MVISYRSVSKVRFIVLIKSRFLSGCAPFFGCRVRIARAAGTCQMAAYYIVCPVCRNYAVFYSIIRPICFCNNSVFRQLTLAIEETVCYYLSGRYPVRIVPEHTSKEIQFLWRRDRTKRAVHVAIRIIIVCLDGKVRTFLLPETERAPAADVLCDIRKRSKEW